MKRQFAAIKITGLFLTLCSGIMASEPHRPIHSTYTDSVSINFRQSKWNLDKQLGDNAAVLDSIDHRLSNVVNDSLFQLRQVNIIGGASPEGSVAFNKFLSEQRAATLFNWFDKYKLFNDIDKSFTFLGRDWEGVLRLAENDPSLPYREETLALLNNIVNEKRSSGEEPKGSLERMKQLKGGEPYRYLYKNIFPAVRASKVIIGYDRILSPIVVDNRMELNLLTAAGTPIPDAQLTGLQPILYKECKPFYMDIRTNMLYDVLALPNIGVEFYLGKDFSLGANWMYAWWKCDHRHRYWRAYGGELFGRWWFGSKAHEKPLTGHHLGVYAQIFTYDFEWGKEGQMGGKPGGNLWDQAQYGAGVEYGYSLPVARRLNIDFSLGVGYVTGKYHKYKPGDKHYVWQSTHHRHYFGPSKAEISLVWLIGCENYNVRKGGVK